VPQKRPTARDVETSPSLRRDLLSFGSAFGEPVTAPHVVHTWPLGWTVGSIGGDAQSAAPKHGSERGRPTPIGWLTRGDHTVPRCSVIGADPWWDLGGCLGRHKRSPPSGSAYSSPRLRRDVPSFGPAVGEPLAGPHVAHTWPLGWIVGSIAGHALTRGVTRGVTGVLLGVLPGC